MCIHKYVFYKYIKWIWFFKIYFCLYGCPGGALCRLVGNALISSWGAATSQPSCFSIKQKSEVQLFIPKAHFSFPAERSIFHWWGLELSAKRKFFIKSHLNSYLIFKQMVQLRVSWVWELLAEVRWGFWDGERIYFICFKNLLLL